MDALRMKTSPWDIQGIECAVWAAEGKTVTLMDQNVYFHSDASGLLDDENGTYQTTILFAAWRHQRGRADVFLSELFLFRRQLGNLCTGEL